MEQRGKSGSEVYRFAMTLQEVAEVLGVSRQAVEQMERRALRKIRDAGLLSEWEDHDVRSKRVD